jgi:hypothetical protein
MSKVAVYSKNNHLIFLTGYYTVHLIPELADVTARPEVTLHSVTVLSHVPLLHTFVYNF